MLESYSSDISVNSNSNIPFNNVVISKGCSAKQLSASSFSLNKKGVYKVTVNISGSATTTAGNIVLQLVRNGVILPESEQQAYSGTTTDVVNIGFTVLVQVPNDNCNCCYSSGVVLNVLNAGVVAEFDNATIVIDKIC